ncbi:SLBB domain-containing protein [Maribellus sp. YY47]|uniref:SLBB domain-containing protein n=1 Tax=Maribellus sp. YY47 TaxID=2929486 RepID=UPI002000EE86|nr:SLBB domain-containing protein [Maribellus sp. YY47]MCK3685183.1 SLBB domain-containing protein [Maribellus sp. YY47]
MERLTIKTFLFLTGSFLLFTAAAQDVKNVDVKSLSNQDIKKAQNAIQNTGLTPEQAAEIARQRGASEEQIREMQQRMLEQQSANQNYVDTITDIQQIKIKDAVSDVSTRTAKLNTKSEIFGSYLFNSKDLTFEPNLNIQTPKNYEIGIGDQILIQIWGNSQNNYQLNVNRNGQIVIPDVGPIFIAGLTFDSAEERIKQRLTEIYADMGGDNPGTFAQVNMGQLRSIQVNLLGEITTPGTYTLPVTATLFNALYLSGGPDSIGSFRNIKVIRDNKILQNVDIYKFLVDADPSGNFMLKDNDIIFVPAAETRVEVKGPFKRNGIFEMKQEENLSDLIRFAGGFTQNAFLSRIQLQRLTQRGKQILDIPYEQLSSFQLMNGDLLSIGKIAEEFKNRVTITGAVYQPGEYEWTDGLTLFDLIAKADSLTPDAFNNRGLITRFNPDLTTTTIPFDVEKVASGKVNIVLQEKDIVTIKSHFAMGEQPYVTINGEVMKPGQMPWSEKITISDLVFMAGGFTEAADSSYIEVSRRLSYDEASKSTDTLVHIFNLKHSRGLKTDTDVPFYLEPFDRVSIKRAPGYREQGSVTITGEVVYAGVYALQNKNQRISDLVKNAKGITPQAFVAGASLKRKTDELGSETIAIDLKTILDNPNGPADLYLRNGDILFVPEYTQTVKVTGAVQNPFSITYEEGKTLKYYIDKTGGFGTEAAKKKVYVKYPNGYTASTKTFIVKNYPEVGPGSEIVVPQKEKREGMGLQGWLAVSSAFSSLAIAIAAVLR